MDNNTETQYSYSTDTPVMCPGKEITSMVFGINAIVWSGLGTLFGLIPLYGMIYYVIWGLVGLGCAITSKILYKKAKEQADYVTKKGETGNKLSNISFIVLGVGLLISIVMLIIGIAIFGLSIAGAAASSASYY